MIRLILITMTSTAVTPHEKTRPSGPADSGAHRLLLRSSAFYCAITTNLPGKMPLLTAENSIALGACESWIRWSRDPASIRSLGAPASRLAEEQFPFGHMAGRCEPTCRETPRHRE